MSPLSESTLKMEPTSDSKCSEVSVERSRMEEEPTSPPERGSPGPPAPVVGTLRPAEAADAAFLRSLYASTRLEELSLLDPAQRESFLELQWRARQRDYRARHPDAEDQIVLVEGTVAGRLLVARRSDELVVVDIALLPEFRGRGIGSRLLLRLLEEATRAGIVVRLHVALTNPALRLYRRLGFSQVSVSGLYALMEHGTKSAP